MAPGPIPIPESDFEKQRLANIAERDALLKKLTQEAHQAGLYSKPSRSATSGTNGETKKKSAPTKRVKREEELIPRRTSSRLQGIQADSEVARRKADDEYEAAKESARVKRLRVSDDLAFTDIAVNGKLAGGSLLGTDVILKGVARPYERTFGEEEIKDTQNRDLKELRKRMNGLELWDAWDPGRIKITPERIYSMAFHPTTTKALVFAGDKLGNLGIVDASQKNAGNLKKGEDGEEKKSGGVDSEEPDDDDPDPIITTIKPHTRTISAMLTHSSKPETLYTASYDSSIRAIDLVKNIAVEIYGPIDRDEDEPLSGIDMAATDPNVAYFTTLNGALGRYDIRESHTATELYQLSEKKIGGFSLNPLAPHYVATASLDRFMRLWDLRKITKKLPTMVGEHESRLSVSHAAFNSTGQVATSSYDDSIKIYSFGLASKSEKDGMNQWKAGYQLEKEMMKPETVVRHNCQTGRWVTM
jgi:WD repeat-containing protein 76